MRTVNDSRLIQLHQMQVLIAGGDEEYCANAQTPASSQSLSIDVTPGANHSIIEEDLAFPRVVSWSSHRSPMLT